MTYINHRTIAILLTTYNSVHFLRQQLDSLYAQTYMDWTLYVSDDNSTDQTLDIIDEYARRYGNIVVLDKHPSLKAMGNFMHLLKEVDSQYYMFCDHDDVWLPNKVENEWKAMQAIDDPSNPCLVYTNLKMVDKDLNVTSPSFWNSIHFDPTRFNNLEGEIFINHVTGCTMMFNAKAREVSFPIDSIAPMHDWWVAARTYMCHGKVAYVSEPQMLYRKYGDNVTGDFVANQEGKSIGQRWSELKLLYRQAKWSRCVHSPLDFILKKIIIGRQRKHIHE